jgi:hypothetical protein
MTEAPYPSPDSLPLGLMDVDAVEEALQRSRASVYRYANTDPHHLNLEYHPKKLNPEIRSHHTEPLMFHPNEVARFAKDVLKIKQVTIEVQNRAPDPTPELLSAILSELKDIRQLLADRS